VGSFDGLISQPASALPPIPVPLLYLVTGILDLPERSGARRPGVLRATLGSSNLAPSIPRADCLYPQVAAEWPP